MKATLLAVTVCALFSQHASAQLGASPFGKPSAADTAAAKKADAVAEKKAETAKFNALNAWAHLPPPLKEKITPQLAKLTAAQRLTLLSTIPGLQNLSVEQKQAILADIEKLVPSAPPVIPLESMTLTKVNGGGAVAANSRVYGITKIISGGPAITNSTIEFVDADGKAAPLAKDAALANTYWLPLVVSETKGKIVSRRNGAIVGSVPVTLTPYTTSGVPGEAVLNYLASGLSMREDAIQILKTTNRSPTTLTILENLRIVTNQQMTWILTAIKNGSVVVDDLFTGEPATLDQAQLKIMDQVALYQANLLLPPNSPQRVSKTQPLDTIFSFFISTASATSLEKCTPKRNFVSTPSVINEIAWCARQVDINDVDEINNYIKAATEGMKFVGSSMALVFPPVGVGIYTAGEVIGDLGDFMSMAVRVSNKEWSSAGQRALDILGDKLSNYTATKLPVPMIIDVAKGVAAYKNAVKYATEQITNALIAKGVADLKAGFKDPAINPPPPPPPPPPPTTSPGGFSISTPVTCTPSPTPGGLTKLKGVIAAELAPGEQITIVTNTAAYYVGPGTQACNHTYSGVPVGTNFPGYVNSDADCVPAEGLSLHPTGFAVCHNKETSGVTRKIFVNVDTVVDQRHLNLSPSIIFMACRATTLNLNSIATVNAARPTIDVTVPVSCGGGSGIPLPNP